MRYFRQALALIREEKLYSAMYIAGTALAVAFVMLIAEVYYVKVADIAPEVRRSTTYYLYGYGVRRAFGATRWSIFWGFIREAWLLTTVSVLLGCIIYFQFAVSRGLYDNFSSPDSAIHLWFDDFGTHFLVVSAVVYLIILCNVLIGTAIPAWRISCSTITDSIREE